MRVVLLSTYEMGRQPFGLASAAAWLRAAGVEVDLHDLSLCAFEDSMVQDADVVGCFVPMHTATRLAEPVIRSVRALEPRAHIVAFGLYAPMNADRLRSLGVDSVLGAEFEAEFVELVGSLAGESHTVVLPPIGQRLIQPDRSGLPALDRYARLQVISGETKVTGYTEATRGCKHMCRHCPVVPVYGGRFVVVEPRIVLDDIRAQVAAGARHVTFGDPDFFNGPAHAMRIVRALHEGFPDLTYDVTIKVEHLARHESLLAELVETGCVLVTTAVESFDLEVLDRFDKRHEPEDFERVLADCRRVGLAINPTFVAFTPWTTIDGYLEFLERIALLGLVGNVSPVQYGIRLLIPAGSLLLDLSEVQDLVGEFDPVALVHPWAHVDENVDRLQRRIMQIVGGAGERSREAVFREVWRPPEERRRRVRTVLTTHHWTRRSRSRPSPT